MSWWIAHIDAVLMILFGTAASLMGAGILRMSKSPIGSADGRARQIRSVFTILGPILVAIGLARAFLPTQSREQWHEVTGDGKFSIMLPAPPQAKEQAADSPLGKVVVHSYVASPDQTRVDYRIRYADLPAPASYENLPQPPQPDVSGIKDFRLLGQHPTTVSGYPATIVDGEGPNGLSVKMEFVWVGPRQYVILRTAGSGDQPSDDKFFSSFRVLAK